MVAYLTKSDASEGFNQVIDFLNGSYLKYALTVIPNIYVSCIKQFWNTVAIKQVNDVTRLQALVDKKKVVVTDAAIREVLRLDDAEGVDCLHNEEIFTELARIGQEIEEEGDADEHVEDVIVGNDAQGDDTTTHGEVPTVTQEPSIPSPTLTIPPSQPHQDIPSTYQVQQTPPQSPQGRMIDEIDKDDVVVLMDEKEKDKKVEKAKVDESAQIQGRQAESQAKIYKINMDHASKVLSMQEDKPAKVQEVVDVVTTAKLITKVVTAASKTVTAASEIISTAKPQVYAATITAAPVKVAATPTIDHVKLKAKEDPAVQRYQVTKRKLQTEAQARKNMMMYLKNVDGFKLDYFKGMSYDNIRLIFKSKFNSNVAFLLKIKEQMEEEENRALQTINETPVEKAAKRRKLNKEVEDLKRHLEIVPDEDDDVYTEATPLARKVPVVDYEIIELNNKPYYKIIRADGTHQLYISFLTLLKNFDREDLEAL
nr:hypothetical protein [Tanacetum cinerariifolium]